MNLFKISEVIIGLWLMLVLIVIVPYLDGDTTQPVSNCCGVLLEIERGSFRSIFLTACSKRRSSMSGRSVRLPLLRSLARSVIHDGKVDCTCPPRIHRSARKFQWIYWTRSSWGRTTYQKRSRRSRKRETLSLWVWSVIQCHRSFLKT